MVAENYDEKPMTSPCFYPGRVRSFRDGHVFLVFLSFSRFFLLLLPCCFCPAPSKKSYAPVAQLDRAVDYESNPRLYIPDNFMVFHSRIPL